MRISAKKQSFRLTGSFRISRGSRDSAEVVVASVEREGVVGRGECTPYARYGESPESVIDTIMSLPASINRGELQDALPPGAARNAVDCALWDFEAKFTSRRVWELAGLPEPVPVPTAFTLSLDTPDRMRRSAYANAHRPLIKIKLGTEGDLDRLQAVREGAPDARIIVDVNEGWTIEKFERMLPCLEHCGVEVLEQPCRQGMDKGLLGYRGPMDICADESCHNRDSLPEILGLYSMINVKLDKTGGLTEALGLIRSARSCGLKVMVGCMLGTSLSLAPALIVAQGCVLADLDAALFLQSDRKNGLIYDGEGVHPPVSQLWG